MVTTTIVSANAWPFRLANLKTDPWAVLNLITHVLPQLANETASTQIEQLASFIYINAPRLDAQLQCNLQSVSYNLSPYVADP